MEKFLEPVLEALHDGIAIIPILLVTYLIMEWIEHRAKNKSF